jgi:hypothetical protein
MSPVGCDRNRPWVHPFLRDIGSVFPGSVRKAAAPAPGRLGGAAGPVASHCG